MILQVMSHYCKSEICNNCERGSNPERIRLNRQSRFCNICRDDFSRIWRCSFPLEILSKSVGECGGHEFSPLMQTVMNGCDTLPPKPAVEFTSSCTLKALTKQNWTVVTVWRGNSSETWTGCKTCEDRFFPAAECGRSSLWRARRKPHHSWWSLTQAGESFIKVGTDLAFFRENR